jgi:hypothetical protein
MYVLQIDATERKYLLSLLKGRRGSTARGLSAELKNSNEVFGVVMWGNDDIASQLKEQAMLDTSENIEAVRRSYYCRHIHDQMVEHGWGILEEGVSELKASHDR